MKGTGYFLLPLAVFVTLSVLQGCGCEDDEGLIYEGHTPSAAFTYSPSPPHLQEEVLFDAGTSTDGDGVEAIYSDSQISLFLWDFGDGETLETEGYTATHTFPDAGEYEVSLTVYDARGGEDAKAETVEVIHWPPEVYFVDVGSDGVAVIGEIIEIHGINFREENTPEVTINGVRTEEVEVLSEELIEVRVPPGAEAGPGEMEIEFPEGEGDAVLEIDVVRFAFNLIPYKDSVQILRAEQGSNFVFVREMPSEDASLVKITGDGSTAYIGDGRWDINLNPTINIVDVTKDGGPEVYQTVTDIGMGPLYDIAFAREGEVGVVADSTGFTVIDIEDPLNPRAVGARVVYGFALSSGIGATDVEVMNDGSMIAALDPSSNLVYFYEVTNYGASELPFTVQSGGGAQDMVLSGTGMHLFVLGGGGEGAIPPDIDTGNTTLTVIDLSGTSPQNACGPSNFLSMEGGIPVPWDMETNFEGDTLYFSTLDQNFAEITGALSDIWNDPGDYNAWIDLADAITNLSFGSVTPASDHLSCSIHLGDPYYSSYGFQTGISLKYDESAYIASTIKLAAEIHTEDLLDIYASINISSGMTIGDTATGETAFMEFSSDPVLLFDLYSATFSYDLSPLIDLFTPPFAYGDTAIQP